MASQHFTADELRCRSGCGLNFCHQKTYDMLEQFRAAAGNKPVIVTSGYRCAEENKRVGGAEHSQHLLGNAADIVMTGMTAAQLEVIARKCPLITGIGRNDHNGMLHIDCRDAVSQWCYDPHDNQIAYYPPSETTKSA